MKRNCNDGPAGEEQINNYRANAGGGLPRAPKRRSRKKIDWWSGGFFLVGAGMVMMALQPVVRGVWTNHWQAQQIAIYPLAMEEFLNKIESGPKILGDFTQVKTQAPIIMEELSKFSNIENWFGAATHKGTSQTQESYTLAIEKLNITNALVKVGGNNIDNNLVQFNPEPNIGGFGAPVIFGHSMLRQFYNPKETNKERYKGIFSTIMTLEIGDEIKITSNGLTYTYEVTEKKEVKPEDDYILAQNGGAKQIKLVTCVPEGTYLRRGVITAELKL